MPFQKKTALKGIKQIDTIGTSTGNALALRPAGIWAAQAAEARDSCQQPCPHLPSPLWGCPTRCSWSRRSPRAAGGRSWRRRRRWCRRWCCRGNTSSAPGRRAGRTAGTWRRPSRWRTRVHWGKTARWERDREWHQKHTLLMAQWATAPGCCTTQRQMGLF